MSMLCRMSARVSLALVLLVASFAVCALASSPRAHASTNAQAMNAYRDYLDGPSVKWGKRGFNPRDIRFFAYDVNHDGTKELIATNDAACAADGYVRLLAYRSGKVVCLGQFPDLEIFKKRCVVHCSTAHGGYWHNDYYVLKNGKLRRRVWYDGTEHFDRNGKFKVDKNYYKSGKRVSKA